MVGVVIDLSAEMATGRSWGAAYAARAVPQPPATLSVCMIVRNEARLLPAALDSIRRELGDVEIVVVDTGSTDDTIAIALAHRCVVIRWAWRDDFAAARNVSIAAATGDWVLVFDADQRAAPGFGEAVRRLLRTRPRERLSVRIVTVNATNEAGTEVEPITRATWRPNVLFPRVLDGSLLRYERRIHEHPGRWLDEHGCQNAILDGAVIVHLGALKALREATGRNDRNERMLLAAVADDPDDLESCAYLARDYAELGEWAKVEGVAQYALGRPSTPEHRGFLFAILRHLCDALERREAWREAFEASRMALRMLEP